MTFANRIVNYGVKPADQFTANPKNARIHPQFQRDVMKDALNTIGFIAPVIENARTGYLIDGHERIMQALADNAPVPFVSVDMSEDEEAYALATFDPITSLAEYDRAQLDSLLQGVQSDSEHVQRMLAELAADNGLCLDGEPTPDPGAQVDKAAEFAAKYGTATGQIWQLGRHRLAIGDCTDKMLVAELMQGDKAHIVMTDPPYNIGYEYASYDDDLSQGDYIEVTRRWFEAMRAISDKIIVTPGRQNIGVWASFDECNIGAWIKENAHGGASIAHFAKWEPIFFYGKHKRERDCDVFTFHVDNGFLNDDAAMGHTCPKPLRLLDDLIQNYTDRGNIVFDLFVGSGTTIIACDHQNRNCRGTEISPEYVAIAIQRWEALTGRHAELIQENRLHRMGVDMRRG